MERASLTICIMMAALVAAACPAFGDCTEIWIDQANGENDPNNDPNDPNDAFKSITYALAVARNLGWPEPWCVYIRPGVYDADPNKPANEREIFPIELRQDMVFEGTDPDICIIDGQDLVEGFAPLLLGNNLTGLQIRGLTLRNMDYSHGNGGAIELHNCSGLLDNCVIENCSAQSGGGMWLSPRGDPPAPFDIIGCTLAGNSARADFGHGGGFRVSGTLTGSVSGCTFSANSTGVYRQTLDGGGFHVSGLTGDITNCVFSGNSADDKGAGFNVSGTLNGNVADCRFEGNSATAGGGGFHVGGTLNGNVTGSRFTGNSVVWQAGHGGGFYVNALNGGIYGCCFTENSTGSRGAGFYVWGALIGNISGCEFLQNSSTGLGVALDLRETLNGKIENCRFSEHEGGAVSLERDSDTMATIRNCLFTAPETLGEVSGWAIRTAQRTIISNNTMVGPGMETGVSPSAIYIDFNTQAENGEIFNNIIGETRRVIHVDAAVDMPITYNQFYNVPEIVCQGEQCLGNDIWWLEQLLQNFRFNEYGDPLFVDPDQEDYHLSSGSPCIDAGDPDFVPGPDERDIDGQMRVWDGDEDDEWRVDMGSDEFGSHCPGDLDGDGDVDLGDLATLLANYGTPSGATYEMGDLDCDGDVDLADLAELLAHYGEGCP